MLFGVNHHEHLCLKVVPDRGDKHIDLAKPMRLERIFVGGIKSNGQGNLILDAIYSVHVGIYCNNLCALPEETDCSRASEFSQSDNSVFHKSQALRVSANDHILFGKLVIDMTA